jgi:hypothetical protein
MIEPEKNKRGDANTHCYGNSDKEEKKEKSEKQNTRIHYILPIF